MRDLLHSIICYIENQSDRLLADASAEGAPQALDQLLGMLTKVTGLLSKLAPLEKDLSPAAQDTDDMEEATSTVDWDVLEYFLKRKKPSL